MTTLIAEVTSWPDVFLLVGIWTCVSLVLCVAITSKWPWQK
jgi:hypothetical protein